MGAQLWPRNFAGGLLPRSALVRTACQDWIGRLDAMARQSNLVRWHDADDGSLDLGESDRVALQDLLQGVPVALGELVRPRRELDPGVLRRLADRALESREEHGVHTLHLGLGLASWRMAGQDPPLAPALLLPVEIEVGATGGTSVRRRGQLAWNPMLLELLAHDHGRAFALLGSPTSFISKDSSLPEDLWAPLRGAAAAVPGFELRARTVIGHFFPHHAHLLRELRSQADRMAGHDILAALAGDEASRRLLTARTERELGPRRIVLPADETQIRAVDAVRRGESCTVQGSPGSGKSQTVANIAAALLGDGQRVLVVAQKRQALAAVRARLEQRGLGDLVLDLMGAEYDDQEARSRIAAAAEAAAPPAGDFYEEERLMRRRQSLEGQIAALHRTRTPSDLSLFDMQSRLVRLPREVRQAGLKPAPWLAGMDAATVRHVKLLLADASDLGDLLGGTSASPWAGARLPDQDAASEAVGLSLRARALWPTLMAALDALLDVEPTLHPRSLAEVDAAARLFAGINASYRRYGPEVWTADVAALADGAPRRPLAPADRDYRAAVRQLRALRGEPHASVRTLQEDVRAMLRQAAQWKTISGQASPPPRHPEADRLLELIEALREPLLKLSSLLGPRTVEGRPLTGLGQLLEELARDQDTPHRIPLAMTIAEELEKHGALGIAKDILGQKIDPSIWPQAFEFLWLEACLNRSKADEPQLDGLYGRDLDRLQHQLLDLERDERSAAAEAVRLGQRRRAAEAVAEHPEQARLLREQAREASLSLKTMLAATPDVLPALFPCWLVSPWAVSQVVDGDRRHFDVVIFDEASQMPMESAIPAIGRGSRLVLAGDSRQLPPVIPPQDPGKARGLLEAFAFLPSYSLGWHYRSLDEALFAFANRRIYDGAVATFPGRLGHGAGLRYVLLGRDRPEPAHGGSPPEGAFAPLLDLVLREAEDHPDQSLGVIALTSGRARQIKDALDARLEARPDLKAFFDQTRPERFFVKPVDLVQGDERDGVILAIGFDDPQQEFEMLWGLLGLRRLNVAITRARRRMTLASRLRREDIPEIGPGSGVTLLRDFLHFAQMRHQGQMAADLTDEPVNPLEEELEFFPEQVYFALRDAGLDVVPQYGQLRHRVDLAVRDPERPRGYVLAIACDDQEQHRPPTRRAYDRQRQLERLGWRYHRIWAGDWAADRDGEVARALEAYRMAAGALTASAGPR